MDIKKSKQFGFTLIELLVVISIVSLLASIIISTVVTARLKAKVAAGQIQDNSTYHAFGADEIIDWEMDEGTGNSVLDSSGYNNTGTYTGAVWTSSTYNNKGNALVFNNSACLGVATLPNLSASVVTTSAWVYLTVHRNYPNIVWHNWVGNGWLLFTDVNGFAYFGIGQAGLQYSAVGPVLSLNTWHFLLGTYDGSKVQLYIDGALVAGTALSNATLDTSGGINVGCGAIGIIDEVRIYNHALTLGMVQKLYAEGKVHHPNDNDIAAIVPHRH